MNKEKINITQEPTDEYKIPVIYDPHADDVYGQYASDRTKGSKFPDPTGTLEIRGDGDFGFHSTGLYDEGGDTLDESTGEVIQEVGELDGGLEGVVIRTAADLAKTADKAIAVDPEDMVNGVDAADKWLKANDPDINN